MTVRPPAEQSCGIRAETTIARRKPQPSSLRRAFIIFLSTASMRLFGEGCQPTRRPQFLARGPRSTSIAPGTGQPILAVPTALSRGPNARAFGPGPQRRPVRVLVHGLPGSARMPTGARPWPLEGVQLARLWSSIPSWPLPPLRHGPRCQRCGSAMRRRGEACRHQSRSGQEERLRRGSQARRSARKACRWRRCRQRRVAAAAMPDVYTGYCEGARVERT
jgi:hypothetical protein